MERCGRGEYCEKIDSSAPIIYDHLRRNNSAYFFIETQSFSHNGGGIRALTVIGSEKSTLSQLWCPRGILY